MIMVSRIFLIFPIVFSIVGCGLTGPQKQTISSFSSSAIALSSSLESALSNGRTATIELRNTSALFDTSDSALWNDYDGILDHNRTVARKGAVKSLKTYAELIDALVAEDQSKAITDAGTKFSNSLQGAAGANISNDDKSAIAKAVASVAGLFLEAKRKHALRTITTKTHPVIVSIGNLLSTEFSSTGAITRSVNAEAARLIGHTDFLQDCVVVPSATCPAGLANDYSAVEKLGDLRVSAFSYVEETTQIYPKLSITATKMVTAHQNMISRLQSNSVNIIQLSEFVAATDEVVTAIEALDRDNDAE